VVRKIEEMMSAINKKTLKWIIEKTRENIINNGM